MISFFFAPESPRPWALMRMILAAALLWETSTRWLYAVELYSTAGFLFPAFPHEQFHPFAFDALTTVILYSVLLVMLAMLFVGWHSRCCALIVFGLTAWFALLDAAASLTKYTAISLHLLFMMSFAQPGGVWSLDAWWRRRRELAVPLASAWPRLLIGFLVASIYLGAAITKIRLPDFATGDLLEFSLLDDAYGGRGLGLWLATKPKLLVLASYATIAFELLFPVLIWVPQFRRLMLFCGIGFHVLLGAMMHLEIFSPVMIAALCAFVKESDLQGIQNLLTKCCRLPRLRERVLISRHASANSVKLICLDYGLFLLLTSGLVAGLVAYQYQHDPSGVFRGASDITYPEVNTELAYEMIDAYKPDYRDYFHRIEIGSRLGHRRVYGDRSIFRPGQVVYVMTRLLQPHPSWDLEWELIAPKDAESSSPAARYHRRLDASHSYASIGFQLKSEFPEGRYLIRLSVSEGLGAKEVITEIPFELIKED